MKERFSGYKVMILSFVYMFCVSGLLTVISVVYAKLPEYLGVDFVKLSTGTSLMKVAALASGLLAISIIRKIGSKKSMLLGAVLCAGIGVSVAMGKTFAAFCLSQIFSGVITGVCLFSMTTGLLMKWFVDKRALTIGMNTGFALAGSSVYLYAGGIICDAYGVATTYLVLGLGTAIVAAVCALFTIDAPEYVGQKALGNRNLSTAEPSEEQTMSAAERRESDRVLYKSPVFWLMMLAVALNINSVGSVQTYATTYLPQFGMDYTEAATIVSLMSLVGGGMTFFSGAIESRLKLNKYIILVFGGSCLANLLMLVYSKTQASAVVVGLVICFGLGYMSYPLENIVVAPVFGEKHAQNVLTKIVAVEHGVMSLTTPMWAKIMTSYGFSTMWILLALINVLTIAVFLMAFRLARKNGQEI